MAWCKENSSRRQAPRKRRKVLEGVDLLERRMDLWTNFGQEIDFGTYMGVISAVYGNMLRIFVSKELPCYRR